VRVDTVLILAAAAVGGQLAALARLPAWCTALGVVWLLRRSAPAWVLVAGIGVFGLASLRATAALERFEVERVRVRDALGPPARCAGAGSVITSPTWGGDALAFVAELSELDCDGRRVSGPLLVRLHGGPAGLARGDRFETVAQLAALQLFRNLDVRDPLPGAARRGVTLSGSTLSLDVTARGRGLGAAIDRVRAHARARILATFSPAAQAMARALVLGENDLDPEDDDAFRRSGLSHMLAVSGTHLVFAVAALVGALGALLVRWEALAVRVDVRRLACFCGIPLALGYADFAGGSGSAWRAAWMLAAAFLARVVARSPRPSRALALSLAVGALVDPLVAFDISFLLSAAATTGLLALGPSLARPVERLPSKVARFVGGSIAATLASMLPCAPLLALLAPELTFAGVIANVLAAPFGETVALPLCLAHVLLAGIPALEGGVALVASGALVIVKQIARESAAARALAFGVPAPNAWQLALIAVFGAGLALSARGTRARLFRAAWIGALALGLWVVERSQRAAGEGRGQLRVSTLDVGQGDANLVEFPNGDAWLIDAGGMVGNPVDTGEAVVLPVLRAKRRSRLDVVVLTHPHPDHFGGLLAVLRAVEVGELWDSGQGEAHGAGPVYAELLAFARGRGIPIRRPSDLCGRKRNLGGAVVELLAPCPAYVPGRDANDNSLVLRVEFAARAALLTGDAEALEERDLVNTRPGALRADLLKAGHHGSRTSTGEALLDAVAPTWVTLSAGVRNRFGHPHAPVLERLERRGIAAVRLDRSGGFSWSTDGSRQSVHTAMPAR
jgi:competence protein ComEC